MIVISLSMNLVGDQYKALKRIESRSNLLSLAARFYDNHAHFYINKCRY